MAGGSEVVIRRSQSIEQANERYRSRPKLPIIYHTPKLLKHIRQVWLTGKLVMTGSYQCHLSFFDAMGRYLIVGTQRT